MTEDEALGVENCHVADFLNSLLTDSVDFIFTDPPYSEKSLHLYAILAEQAARVLKPGHLCMCYCGALFFPDVFRWFEQVEGLEWHWLFREKHNRGFPQMFKSRTLQAGKPILSWYKPDAEGNISPSHFAWTVDEFTGGRRDKRHHRWGQGVEAAIYFIEAYTRPGELVIDPFVGGGTTAIAAKRTGRSWLVNDLAPDCCETTRRRLREQDGLFAAGQSAYPELW